MIELAALGEALNEALLDDLGEIAYVVLLHIFDNMIVRGRLPPSLPAPLSNPLHQLRIRQVLVVFQLLIQLRVVVRTAALRRNQSWRT